MLLDSIAAEHYPRLEVLVIDDGSTDGSRQVVEAWAVRHPERPIRLISRQNRGLSATLNELLAMASGRFAAIVASDDLLLPGGIGRRVAWLEAHRTHRAVFGDCVVIDAEGRQTLASGIVDRHRADKRRLARDVPGEVIRHWSVPGPVLLAETAALREVGGWDEQLRVEDWDLYLRLAARGWLGFVDHPVAAYRVHDAAASRDLGSSSAHAREMAGVATRALPMFRGRHRLFVVRQIARWRAREAQLEDHPLRYLWWGGLSRLLRLAGAIVSLGAR
jgi:GT2 family glycosyltransferase